VDHYYIPITGELNLNPMIGITVYCIYEK